MDVKTTRTVRAIGWLCMALSIGMMLTSIALSDEEIGNSLLVVGLGLLVVGIAALGAVMATKAKDGK